MPTGPGDEILDAIEKGTADSIISKKYGVNTDQLRLFKSLHYGLSNQRMGYDEIGNYFPELNTYFTPSVSTKQSAPLPKAPLAPKTVEDPWTIKGKESMDVLNKALQENDDVVENTIKEHRYMVAKEQKLNEFAAGPRTDMPAAQALALQKQQYLEPEVKPQDIPVTKEEVEQRKAEIDSDENVKRDFLKKLAQKKPDKAAEIFKSTYQLDAAERAKGSEDKMQEVQKNLERLEKGELKYDPTTGTLMEPEGFFEGLITGAFERNEQLRKYERYAGNEKDLVEKLEYDRKYHNPDKPVPVPSGTGGEIGQMAGMEWAPLLKGAGVGVAATMAGNPEAAPFVNAMINAPEYYKRSYWTALEQTYNQLRNEGKEPDEALKVAQAQAEDEGKYGALEGAVSSAIGSRMGLKSLPKLNISSGFKNAAAKTLSSTAKYAGEQTIDGVVDGLVAGAMQDQKNVAAGEKGIFRTEGADIAENVKGEVTFALATGAMTKAGSALVDAKLHKKLLYHLARQPKETFEAKIGEMVDGGQMTPEDAKDVSTKVKAQREVDKKIPDDIKDVSRQAMADKIKERDELEKKLEEVDKALHPPIKEKIKKLEEEILEHSTHKKPEQVDDEEDWINAQRDPDAARELRHLGYEKSDIEKMTPDYADQLVEEQTHRDINPRYKPEQADGAEAQEQQSEAVESTEQQIPGAENNVGLEGEPVPGVSKQTTEEPIYEEATGPTRQQPTPKQQKFYETSIGGVPSQSPNRIPVDPIVGGEAKEVNKILKDVSRGLKQPVFYAKPGRGGLGTYLPGFKGIKIKFSNDLDTTAHELGHSIDDQFDIYTEAAEDPAVVAEWEAFAEHGGSEPPANHPNPAKYKQKEGFAEWLRGYILNPKEAEVQAPATTALYKRLVNPKAQEVITNFSNDVRTWAGSEGKDITMANVEFEPDKKPGILNELFKKQQSDSEFSINWVNKLAANFINPLNAFEKAFKHAKGIMGDPDVLPENDPIILSRILLGIDGKFGEILKSGMVDGRGEVLTDENGKPMNLNWLLEPFDNTDMKTIEKDMRDTIAYMISERVEQDLSKRFEQGEVLSGAGAGIYTDFQVAQKTLNEFHKGDSDRLARIQEAAKRYREFSKAIMQYAVDKGRLSQEQYDKIVEENEHYVAMQRVLEAKPDQEIIAAGPKATSTKLGSKADIIHRLKGSSRKIKNPYSTLLDTLYKTMRESDRNDVLRAFTDMLQNPRYSNEGTLRRISDIGIKGMEGDDETISVFKNGKAEKWIFQKDVYAQLKGLDKDAFRLPGLFTAPAKILRAFTTKFPVFAARNWIRDTQDRIIKSTTGSGFKELVGDKEDWNAIARAGGLNSGVYFKDKKYYNGLLKEAMDLMAKDKKFILADPVMLKHAWRKYEDLLYKGETSNRVAEYRSAFKEAKKKGMDDYNASIYAAFKARDLIDFAIMGHWMKIANQIVPFSNAAVQGLRSAAISFKNNPGAFMGRLMIYSIAPQVAAWFWNHRNEEDEKQYEEHPAYIRDMFWNFRIGPDKWLSMPKPYELSLPAAGMDRLLSYMNGNEKAFDHYDESIKSLLLPFDEGNIAGPFQVLVEELSNYDFFRDRNIIPPDEDPLRLAIRHTETGSRLGQLIQKIAGFDARKVDHFFKRQFSYTGALAVKISDIGKEDSRHEFDLTDTGFFKRTPAYSSVSVQEMISYAKLNGLTKSPPYKGFNKIVGAYFDAKTGEEREQIADEMIEYSKELLKAWKEMDMEQYQEERADAKKEARKK